MEDEAQDQGMTEVNEGPGFFSKLVNIFTNPQKTFIALDQKPTWFMPLLIVILLVIAFTMITFDVGFEQQLEKLRSNPDTPQAQIDGTESSKGIQQIITPISILIIMPIVYLLLSAIFYFTGSVILGGKASFKKVLSVYTWSTLIAIPAMIVKLPLVFVKGDVRLAISPALVLPGEMVDSSLYTLLSQFDFFTIWQLAVFAYGFSLIYRFSTGKAFTAVGILWAIWIAIAVVGAEFFKSIGMM